MHFIRRLFSKKDYTHKHVEIIMGFLTPSLQKIPIDYIENQVRINMLFYILGVSTSYCKHMKLPNNELEIILKALSPLLKKRYQFSLWYLLSNPDVIPFSIKYDFLRDIVQAGIDDFDKAMTAAMTDNPFSGTVVMNSLELRVLKWHQDGITDEYKQYLMDVGPLILWPKRTEKQ